MLYTLEKFHYERFFTIGAVHYRRFHCNYTKRVSSRDEICQDPEEAGHVS